MSLFQCDRERMITMKKKEKAELKDAAKKMFHGMMNTKEKLYIYLDEFKAKHNFIPEQYKSDIRLMNGYYQYKNSGSWRKNPVTKLTIKKSIELFCENETKILEPEKSMTKKQTERYLKKQTKEIYASIERAKTELNKIHGVKAY